MTGVDFERAAAEVERLCHELDITNADHIVLWLETNLADGCGATLGYLACRIVEAHERAMSAAADEIKALRKGVEAIANGDVSRPIGKRYRSDLKPSKHDRCVHDKWMYEDCGNCIEAFATALLKGTPDGKG